MKITYLGTGATHGLPAQFCNCPVCTKARADVKNRKYNTHTRAQYLIDDDILIDFPPDSLAHELLMGLDFSKVKDILITHYHGDHFYPNGVCSIQRGRPRSPLTFHMSDDCRKILVDGYYGGDIERLHKVDIFIEGVEEYVPISIGKYEIIPIPAHHSEPGHPAFLLIFHNKVENKNYFHFHDTGRLTDDVLERIASYGYKFDLLTFDCVGSEEDVLVSWGEAQALHMGLPDFVIMRDKLAKLGVVDSRTRCVASHLAHTTKNMCYDDFKPFLDNIGAEMGYDGLVIEW